jgi:hypothetical protein
MKRFLFLVVFLALLGGGFAYLYGRLLPPPPPPPPAAEIERLRALRNAMEERLKAAVAESGERGLARAPRGDIMIGLSTAFTSDVAERVTTGLFGDTTIRLQNLKVRKEGEVKAKMLFGKRKVGDFLIEVDIQEARGRVRPSRPSLSFAGRQIGIALPFDLAEGDGRVQIRFFWDSKGVTANLVCGNLDVTREVTGTVVPQHYEVKGGFDVRVEGSALVLTPQFPELAVQLFVEPTEQAWGVVDAVMADQRAGCRMALEKMDIKKILGKILGRGFNIKIPPKILRAVRLPAGLRQSLSVQGVNLSLDLHTTDLTVSPERLWYGANVETQFGAPSPPRE